MPSWFLGYSRTEIPEDKAVIVKRLDEMALNDWTALDSMGFAELDALEAEASGARVSDLDVAHPHNARIQDTLRAIKHRRIALRRESSMRYWAQSNRHEAITAAEASLRNANRQIERAFAIPLNKDINKIPAPFAPIDAPSMSDEELTATIEQCKPELNRKPSHDWRVVSMLKTAAAKAIASELKEREAAISALVESARTNVEAAQSEIERRRAESAAQEAAYAELRENIVGAVSDLQSRVKELEQRK